MPRRYAVHPLGTEGYSVIGAAGAALFAAGFVLYLVAVARLVTAGRAQPAEAPERDRPGQPRRALVPPVRTDFGFSVLSGLIVVSVVALLGEQAQQVADYVATVTGGG